MAGTPTTSNASSASSIDGHQYPPRDQLHERELVDKGAEPLIFCRIRIALGFTREDYPNLFYSSGTSWVRGLLAISRR